ncbi:capsule biosynthesis protein [Neisseriaceae bacterium B1]
MSESEQKPSETTAATNESEQAKAAPQPEKVRPEVIKVPKKRKPFNWLIWVVVALPTAISAVYFGAIASDQYVSQSSFVVRSAKNQASAGALGALFQGMGIARSQDDTYAVQEYMRSRSALGELSKTIPVRSFYEQQGDVISRFNGFNLEKLNSDEAFYQYYSEKVGIGFDSISGISTLRVWGFNPEQSQQINQALLKKGEHLINQINDRARKDTITFAENNVTTAQEAVRVTAEELMAYRTKNGVLDLKEQSGMQLALISKLQDELIAIQTQLDQVRAVTPENPQIEGLQTREKSLQAEIRKQTQLMTGKTGRSIANQAAQYQQLTLENDLAEKQLAAAMTALESARAEADRQQLYLEVVAQPNRPDMPQKPDRIYNIVATFFISLMVYGILKLLGASVREHKN